ncbi:N-acetyltransferase [Vibrio alginolyticus]|uniref:N-acetyltransferase n=1 Tax=Vibrio alginolyticus TaxID=663 RepID=UPI000A2906AB|nr:acyltransferase [Vibrio alginolyticus]ARP01909.1 dTDP-3-amino-3,6-dideoxy-alpha-D-galactopyranose 3-N-acetyltransferase [Vibrio alginolyticus]
MRIHALSDVASSAIGEGTSIWQFAVVLAGAKIGRDCNICAHTFIENDVVLGDRVTVKCGVYLWDGIEIEDDVFMVQQPLSRTTSSHVQKYGQRHFQKTKILSGASIGANATILPGITIGKNAMVGAGSVVTRSVPDYAVVVGKPS